MEKFIKKRVKVDRKDICNGCYFNETGRCRAFHEIPGKSCMTDPINNGRMRFYIFVKKE